MAFNFLGIGDWGGAALGNQNSHNVYAVAAEMEKVASIYKPAFIVNTGDNFYWCGIVNTSDYQISVDYEEPYAAASLQMPWLSSLGNHEYGYNVDAQIEYASINKLWVLPSRYYIKRFEVDSVTSTYMSLVVLDTSPCISAYRNSDPSGWDPCNEEYPTCSLTSTDDDFEGPCMFNSNILSQDCGAQFQWFQDALAAVPTNDWLLVVGHHPIDEVDAADFTAVLQKHGFSLYMNGHTHTLSQYTIDSKGAYVTTGAGAMVNTADQGHPTTAAKAKGINNMSSSQGHTYQTVFNSKTAGFTQHTFVSNYTQLRTDFISYTGLVLHSFNVNRQGIIT